MRKKKRGKEKGEIAKTKKGEKEGHNRVAFTVGVKGGKRRTPSYARGGKEEEKSGGAHLPVGSLFPYSWAEGKRERWETLKGGGRAALCLPFRRQLFVGGEKGEGREGKGRVVESSHTLRNGEGKREGAQRAVCKRGKKAGGHWSNLLTRKKRREKGYDQKKVGERGPRLNPLNSSAAGGREEKREQKSGEKKGDAYRLLVSTRIGRKKGGGKKKKREEGKSRLTPSACAKGDRTKGKAGGGRNGRLRESRYKEAPRCIIGSAPS